MISFTSGELETWLAAFLWPFLRILGAAIAAPLPGGQRYPARVKVGLAVLIALVIAPNLPPMPQISPASLAGTAISVEQLMIGLAIGFAVRLVFVVMDMAGDLIGLQMGLGFAYFYDPRNAAHTAVLGQFLGLLAALTFLAMDGHLIVIGALADSFRTMPIGETAPDSGFAMRLASAGGGLFRSALLLSLPIIAAMLVTNVAMGVLARAAPQLNVFAVGFPVTLALGLIMLGFALPFMLQTYGQMAAAALGTLIPDGS